MLDFKDPFINGLFRYGGPLVVIIWLFDLVLAITHGDVVFAIVSVIVAAFYGFLAFKAWTTDVSH